MHRFFIEPSDIDTAGGVCRITGSDVNHIGNVLRMKKGEKILLCTGLRDDPSEYLCEIDEIRSDEVSAVILDLQKNARELPADIYLFQAIPKGDRFETVIEKGVELGVHCIIPVMSSRTIVKLDESRAKKKAARWNALALSAAKQSKRSFVPEVKLPVSWSRALEIAGGIDKILVPYENAEGIGHTRSVISGLDRSGSIGIFIGPEGGFEDKEIGQLEKLGAEVITLGHRILRTDTAGIAVLSMLMLQLEA
ncbi:MAG: 16S rRNA (uracil(1498)-N(3))-methyltransferase [Lachnospiraceae bacterium]|nr:16S rRNA (uracil(1498)-N(3))-methyltransferase [Lachnospiraceae bacterium]